MIEILAGPLVGAAYGKQVKGTATCNEKCTKGDLFIAIDPDKFLGLDKFKREVNSFINEIRTSEPNAIIPGDMEVRNIDKYKEAGLNVDTKLYDILNEICKNLNINLDEFIEQ
jgi:L-2-hydroxycarboxylate dehydrogenase (NAD+)